MTLRSNDLQSDSDLDSIRNSCDVFQNFFHKYAHLILDQVNKSPLEIIAYFQEIFKLYKLSCKHVFFLFLKGNVVVGIQQTELVSHRLSLIWRHQAHT